MIETRRKAVTGCGLRIAACGSWGAWAAVLHHKDILRARTSGRHGLQWLTVVGTVREDGGGSQADGPMGKRMEKRRGGDDGEARQRGWPMERSGGFCLARVRCGAVWVFGADVRGWVDGTEVEAHRARARAAQLNGDDFLLSRARGNVDESPRRTEDGKLWFSCRWRATASQWESSGRCESRRTLLLLACLPAPEILQWMMTILEAGR
ncbi:hypothetical protein B0T09DRAFT_186313 [Sordaria sp. MPI-SDFR-AT-0083]|nr:hypothetical protein B0T09DRAFT_186313 [Sordaria sp. MPI-SDFR-AT-0083]